MTSPFGPLVLIANPNAGRGAVDKALPGIERVLADQNLSYRVVRTTHPGHATEAARQALRDGERLPGNPVQGAAHLAGDQVRPIDVGTVTFTDQGVTRTRCFVNIAEAGLGGAVVARAAGLKAGRFLGGARYAAGFWLTLPRFRPAAVRLDANGQYRAWRAFNVVVANCRFYGGGMQISPNSDPGDCLLDILVMTGPKSDSFTTLPKVYKGAHLPHRNIAELRAAQLSIEAEPYFQVEADGELLGTTPASFGIIPGALRLKV